MPEENFKPITEADLGLTPKELDDIIKGAQKYLPPEDEDGNPIPTTTHADKP